jgi:hypothetical protein
MILLWGLPQDAPLRLVRDALVQRGAPFLFLNQADLLETHVEVEYTPSITGVVSISGREYRLEDIGAIYLRPYDFRDFPQLSHLDANSSQWRHALAAEDALWGLADLAEAVVVNRPSAMRSNSSKPYQCRRRRSSQGHRFESCRAHHQEPRKSRGFALRVDPSFTL